MRAKICPKMLSINCQRTHPFHSDSPLDSIDDARLICQAFGFVSEKTKREFNSIIHLFRRRTMRKGQIILRSGQMTQYVWLLVSGICIGVAPPCELDFRPGSWIGLETARSGDTSKMTVKAESIYADFLRIRLLDFVYKLPRDLTHNIESRISAISKLHSMNYNKEFRIHKSVLDEIRNPSPRIIPSARLLSVREINNDQSIDTSDPL